MKVCSTDFRISRVRSIVKAFWRTLSNCGWTRVFSKFSVFPELNAAPTSSSRLLWPCSVICHFTADAAGFVTFC